MIAHFKYKPLVYFTLTFLITFALWAAGAYFSYQEEHYGVSRLLLLIGLLTPFLISLVFIFTSKSAEVKKDFVNRLFNIRLMRLSMLPAFLFLMPLVVLASIGISLLFGGSTAQFQVAEELSFSIAAVPALLILILAATFEELGWRGYAFDSLQSRFNYFKASLIFGILWSLWHFPLIFVNNSYQYEILHENIWYAVNFFVSIIPMGIIISWICIKNRKSVIAAILFHFIINMSQEALSMTQATKCIETGVLTVLVIGIIAYEKELFFSKAHLAGQESPAGSASAVDKVGA